MVNAALLAAILISLVVWLLQEILGRRYRIELLCEHPQKIVALGPEAGFPLWLRFLSGALLASWAALALAVYYKRDGDFALILVALVLFCGVVSLLDSMLFRQRRVQLMGAAPVQQILSRIKVDSEKQQLVDWAETDYVTAEYAKSFFPVLLVVLILRSFLLEPFKIPSASMVPTLAVHDFILVNKFAYGLRLPVLGTQILPLGMPQRGDVMVFFPPNDKRYFIKRVIGLPGDEIDLVDNMLYINGVQMQQKPLRVEGEQIVSAENLQPLEHLIQRSPVTPRQGNYHAIVPQGHYFMVGDNRDNSSDSRFWGMVPEANIVGRAVYVWMHWEPRNSFPWLSLPSFAHNGVIQ